MPWSLFVFDSTDFADEIAVLLDILLAVLLQYLCPREKLLVTIASGLTLYSSFFKEFEKIAFFVRSICIVVGY